MPAGLARMMKEAYEDLSPFIEKHTMRVCPVCERVCCIDRHGSHEAEDIMFLEALGEGVPPVPRKKDDTQPCRHLGPSGCAIPRWQRPYRCTWYFCARLLDEMPHRDPREYREFVRALGRLKELRGRAAEALIR
jgi:hypothetical protein